MQLLQNNKNFLLVLKMNLVKYKRNLKILKLKQTIWKRKIMMKK